MIHTGANARAQVTWGEAFFLVRLSRQRFIPRSRKTNGKIVSKILTAHLGEHVLAPRGYSLRLLSHLIRPSSMPVVRPGIRDKDKGAGIVKSRGAAHRKVFRVGPET